MSLYLSFNAPKGGNEVLTANPGGIIALFCQVTPTSGKKSLCEHRKELKKRPDARKFRIIYPHILGWA